MYSTKTRMSTALASLSSAVFSHAFLAFWLLPVICAWLSIAEQDRASSSIEARKAESKMSDSFRKYVLSLFCSDARSPALKTLAKISLSIKPASLAAAMTTYFGRKMWIQ